MSHVMINSMMWFPNRFDTNWAVQAGEWLEAGNFWIKKVDESNYCCGENKGADQLCSYCEADLCLCFCI